MSCKNNTMKSASASSNKPEDKSSSSSKLSSQKSGCTSCGCDNK